MFVCKNFHNVVNVHTIIFPLLLFTRGGITAALKHNLYKSNSE